LIRRGTTVGANATVVCGITLGRYSFIAAGAVVTKDVPDYAFILGVPARQKGWMSRHGHILDFKGGSIAVCAESGLQYELKDNKVHCLDLDEEAPLPAALAEGKFTYDQCKTKS
jgi:UDP-2-acetamido-3-amino-2,3-dideoxy-glucuronate N-acetyltransferase